MACALLVEARMPKRYWFWALREAIIRMNLLPCQPPSPTSPAPTHHEAGELQDFPSVSLEAACRSSSVALTTPFELFYGIKPDYRTLFQWGCLG
jgi:hypothetical protein